MRPDGLSAEAVQESKSCVVGLWILIGKDKDRCVALLDLLRGKSGVAHVGAPIWLVSG